jgi:hypothetical protein
MARWTVSLETSRKTAESQLSVSGRVGCDQDNIPWMALAGVCFGIQTCI